MIQHYSRCASICPFWRPVCTVWDHRKNKVCQDKLCLLSSAAHLSINASNPEYPSFSVTNSILILQLSSLFSFD